MRKIVMLNWVSLDGYFAGQNGEFDWMIRDPNVDKATHEVIDADTLLLGRETYHHLESFWPKAALDPNLPENVRMMANEVNGMTKIVFSTTRKDVTWENSKLVRGNLVEEVNALKQAEGSDIMILGSGTIVQQLTQEGLIDEYVIIVTPVVLGRGKSLFKDVRTFPLTLVANRSFESGNVVLHYKRAVADAK